MTMTSFVINVRMAFMAKITINMKNNDDVTIQGDVIASDVIVIARTSGRCGDLTSTRREEKAAGLLLALPRSTTTIEKEEEMPCTGSLLLDLPLQLLLQQQPFSQGLNVVIKFGKGGEGGEEEEKEEVPGHGSLLLLSNEKNKRNVPGFWCTMKSHEKNRKKLGKKKKLKTFVASRKEFVFCGVVILDPHTHPSPPVACGWGPPA